MIDLGSFPFYEGAKCYGTTQPDAWFPRAEDIVTAKELCNGCPIIQPCREYATTNKLEGIWGATTTGQRRRQAHGRETCGSHAGYVAHIKASEAPCPPCLTARRAYKTAWKQVRRESA